MEYYRAGVGKLWPWAKSSQQPIFTNKVLSEYKHTHLFTDFLWLLSHYKCQNEWL